MNMKKSFILFNREAREFCSWIWLPVQQIYKLDYKFSAKKN